MNTLPTLVWSFLLTLFFSTYANATVDHWAIDKKNSSITFQAMQNNAPVTGQFGTFDGQINFSPIDLANSSVQITVDLASVATTYKDVGETLKTAEWFNIALFPKALFKSKQFVKTGENTYQANGTLTLRDKTLPVSLDFVLNEYTQNTAHAEGSATIKRNAFGVGQGEWEKTDNVADNVIIKFTLSVKK